MSKKEQQILEIIKEAMPNMSEYDKGYLLGYSEGRVREKRMQEQNEKTTKVVTAVWYPKGVLFQEGGRSMAYTCEICTDYIDPSKRDEILKNVTKIITESYRRQKAEEKKKEEYSNKRKWRREV